MSTNPKKTEETPPPENVTPIKKPSSFSLDNSRASARLRSPVSKL